MKQKKNLFNADYVGVNAVEILVTKKIEKNFCLTKWSHFIYIDELTHGADFRQSASKYVTWLAKKYPNMYFMEKSVTIINCR